MTNHMTITKNWVTPNPMNIGLTSGLPAANAVRMQAGQLFYGRVQAAAAARTRGGVLRWFPSR